MKTKRIAAEKLTNDILSSLTRGMDIDNKKLKTVQSALIRELYENKEVGLMGCPTYSKYATREEFTREELKAVAKRAEEQITSWRELLKWSYKQLYNLALLEKADELLKSNKQL